MKRYLKYTLLFLLPLVFMYAFLVFTISGYTDTNYFKVSSPKQNSLIIGDSRALQGLVPKLIDSVSGRNNLLNFAFNIGNAPYGKIYLKAIKKKLDRSNKNGVFILSVNPWAISSTSANPNDITTFRENGRKLDRIRFFSLNPNVDYIYNYISPKTMVNGLLKNYNLVDHTFFLHDDGWLELFIPMDENTVSQRINYKVKDYSEKIYQISNKRLEYLEETISFLKKYGAVFLVRLPVHTKILELENNFIPEFDLLMGRLALKHKIPYINFSLDSTKYSFTDGNHLYKESSKEVSIKLGEIIKENLKIK